MPWKLKRLILIVVTFVVVTNVMGYYYLRGSPPLVQKQPVQVKTYGYHGPSSCEDYGWKPREKGESVRIWDCFLFNTELDFLEIRLFELNASVHKFIIAESTKTFSGKLKPLHYYENKQRFVAFENRIVHVKLDLPFNGETWQQEDAQRMGLIRALDNHATAGDIVLISDVDELPRASTVNALSHCEGYKLPINFCMRHYLYSFAFRKPKDWAVARAQVYCSVGGCTDYSRYVPEYCLADSGWHCSWCFSDIDLYINKLESWSHQEANTAEYKEVQYLLKHLLEGKDIQEREDQHGILQVSLVGIPRYLQEYSDKYMYLTNPERYWQLKK